MNGYLDYVFDVCPGYGFEGGPTFSTQIVDLQSGREKRNAMWAKAKHRYSAPFVNISKDAYKEIKKLHLVCRGKLNAFKMIDPLDDEAINEVIGVGNGVLKEFQLQKVSAIDGISYVRNIFAIVDSNDLDVYKNTAIATGYILDKDRGTIVFDVAPASGVVIKWSGKFAVWVRFDQDELPFTLDNPNRTNGEVTFVEVAPPPPIVV